MSTTSQAAQHLGLSPYMDYAEVFFLEEIEKGLQLIGEPITVQEIEALRVRVPDHISPTSPSPTDAQAGLQATVQVADLLGGREGLQRWNDRAVRALKAQFDLEIGRAKESRNDRQSQAFKKAVRSAGINYDGDDPVKAANHWVETYNDLDRVCRRPALIAPVQNWVRQHGMQDVRAARASGCFGTAVLAVLLTSAFAWILI